MISVKFVNNTSDKFEYVKSIRNEVFTNEQGAIANEEYDSYDNDKATIYALVFDNDCAVATGRIAIVDGCAKIGRIAVLKNQRGKGTGKLLVNSLLGKCKQLGYNKVKVDAQLHAVEFYKKLGFVADGNKTVIDRGIEHMPMVINMSKKKKSKLPTIIIVVAVVVAVVAVATYFYSLVQKDINGTDGTSYEYTLVIEKSDFEYEIGQKLYRNKIVVYDAVWTNWMSKHYPNFEYINGEYNLKSDMSYEEIAQKLQNPDVSHKTVKVCIPEGYNVMEIASTLEENGVCSANDFLEVCKSTDGFDYDWLSTIPDDSLIAYKLEGFLFPATYDLAENSDPAEVADTMLDAFDDRLSDKMTDFCTQNDMTLYQLITLASVVQEEALGNESAGNIASVFINRLNKGAKLQSDVTYYYAVKLRDEQGFSQEVYDAYYTYRCKGLPAGPITNSGTDIINAVIEHPDTDYLYFFSDLQQQFHFAKDYDTFVALQEKYPWK